MTNRTFRQLQAWQQAARKMSQFKQRSAPSRRTSKSTHRNSDGISLRLRAMRIIPQVGLESQPFQHQKR